MQTLTVDHADPLTTNRIPTFSHVPDSVPEADRNAQNLNGLPGTLPSQWGIDWSFFLDGLPTPPKKNPDLHGQPVRAPQPSYRIDALLVGPLADLPEFFKDTDAMPLSMVGNLAFRNLLCGQKLGLPSGERAAVAFGVPPLGPDVLWNAGSRLLDDTSLEDDDRKELKETRKKREAVRTTWVDSGGPLAGNTPLWYYVLREAEYYGVDRDADDDAIGFGGQHLGPLGSRIVAETLIGLLWLDQRSFLHAHRPFRPLDAIAGDSPLTLPEPICARRTVHRAQQAPSVGPHFVPRTVP